MTEGDDRKDITGGRVVNDLPVDCIGDSMYKDSLMVDDEKLRGIEYMINERMEFIICRRCELAVPPEYLCIHLHSKHKIDCSEDTLQSIMETYALKSLDTIVMFKDATTLLEVAVGGIRAHEGYKCLDCSHYTRVWGSMLEHFRLKHADIDVKEHTEEGCKMQCLFGGRLKKWMGISDHSMAEVEEDNESAWEAVKVMLAKKRHKARAPTGREENVRLLNGFVARTRWDILIEGHDKKQLRALAAIAKENDPLHKVMEVSEKYFTEISDKLRMGDMLLRRKIESEG